MASSIWLPVLINVIQAVINGFSQGGLKLSEQELKDVSKAKAALKILQGEGEDDHADLD
jgi:hypothetical protein